MKSYLAHIKINLKLTLRDRMVLFFNYAFPLVFFFIFAQAFDARQSGMINQVVSMVFIIGVLGTGFFGAGLRAVQERETNILRRFKVAPITPAPILAASLVVGLLAYLPAAVLFLLLAHFGYGMQIPPRTLSLLVFLSIAVVAFRAIGMVIGAVVNSMQESQILIQLLYLPMLFLSGATFPLSLLPEWLQVVGQFLPATHLYTGLQGILLRHESIADNGQAVLALLLTTFVATFIGMKLFRWEKEEKLPASAKLWLLAVFAPFLLLGAWEARSRGNIEKARVLEREMARGRTVLIRDARIVVGDGAVIPQGAVLLKAGRIEEVYPGAAPKAAEKDAAMIEGSGKTVMPGLIDSHVHLSGPAGLVDPSSGYDVEKAMRRALLAYLYSGVTAVHSVGDGLDLSLKLREEGASGRRLQAELFANGPMFTAEGGHGTEYFNAVPEKFRAELLKQFVRTPATADEARKQVRDLKTAGVDGIKVILEAGHAGILFNRLDSSIARATIEEAHALGLRVVVHTGDSRDVADAVAAGADGIEHGSHRDRIADDLLVQMAKKGVRLDPTLAVGEAWNGFVEGKTDLLDRPLVQQVGPLPLLQTTKSRINDPEVVKMRQRLGQYPMNSDIARENTLRAFRAGVPIVAGSDSGNLLVIHGPAIHRELQLLVEAGLPPEAALKAATGEAAKLLGADGRTGLIAKGREATLLLLDGDPVKDITATERISAIYFKGERVGRTTLFEEDKK